jgi:gluconolactonase
MNVLLLLLLLRLELSLSLEIFGDEGEWDAIFSSREPEVLAIGMDGLEWTEGPTWLTEEGKLLFSDTVTNKIWTYDPSSQLLVVFLDWAGGCVEDCEEKAEPGTNGLWYKSLSLYACRHGARDVAVFDFMTAMWTPLATSYGGRRLNSPNDLHVLGEWLYFTDPIYGFLQKSRFEDAKYLDDLAQDLGTGYKGVYKLSLSTKELELLDDSMVRPNGIQVGTSLPFFSSQYCTGEDGTLYVSECCQGIGCDQGEAFWKITKPTGERTLIHVSHPEQQDTRGCADGFKIHPPTGYLVASCPAGLCILDPQKEALIARLETPYKISNVLFADDFLYITGEQGLWRLPLTQQHEGEVSTENKEEL